MSQVIIDVRERDEFEAEHIEHSITAVEQVRQMDYGNRVSVSVYEGGIRGGTET